MMVIKEINVLRLAGIHMQYFKSEKLTKGAEAVMFSNKMPPGFRSIKIMGSIHHFLKQGLSCEKLAFSIALGITLGTFPVLGVTTVLCMLAAFAFRLNLPVIQFANYFVYPLQIVLLVPYYRLGGLVFNARQNFDFNTLKKVLTQSTPQETITMLLDSTLNAIGAWLIISPLALALLYTGLKPILIRFKSSSARLKLIRR